MALSNNHSLRWCVALLLTSCFLLTSTGCQSLFAVPRNRALEASLPPVPADQKVPNGESMITLPPYVIEPPDLLLIDALKVVPKPPYHLEPLDILSIRVEGTFPDKPIDGAYQVEGTGVVNLGLTYGSVNVMGRTVDEAIDDVYRHLSKQLSDPSVSITLAQTSGTQQIAGDHQVAPDGTVSLGMYGQVYVTGLTIHEAKLAIEKHLSEFLEAPEVAVDIGTFSSKVYYIITDGAGTGDQVVKVPITGNETVLDAISNIGGLAPVSSQRMWIARRAPDKAGFDVRLPIDWYAITARGSNATNYQLMPGDRLFIDSSRLSMIDTFVGQVIAPFQRTASFISLTSGAIRTLSIPFGQRNNNNSF